MRAMAVSMQAIDVARIEYLKHVAEQQVADYVALFVEQGSLYVGHHHFA